MSNNNVCFPVRELFVQTIDELVKEVLPSKLEPEKINFLYFRGENQDFGETAFTPLIYRRNNYLHKEHIIYREMQRFNDQEFATDRTAFDKLARMQHYQAPSRMLDISEDLFSALYFALKGRNESKKSVVYMLEIDHAAIKYYDSDSVSVIANLAKMPLGNNDNCCKSQRKLHSDVKQYFEDKEEFNKQKSVEFLVHEICEEKSYFRSIINPSHLFSIFCVKPKYTNQRIHGQKGAFLLFGMNRDNVEKAIPLFRKNNEKLEINAAIPSKNHPIRKITKFVLSADITLSDLASLGITTPYIYPEMDRVAGYLKE